MYKKSIFIMLFMAVIGYVSAQSLRFELNGNVYSEGEIVVCTNDIGGEYFQEMQIRNLTDQDLNVMIEKEVIADLEGVINYFCWGLCFGPDVTVSPNPVTVAANSVTSTGALSFHAMFEENVYGKIEVKYSAYDERHPEDRVTINVVFHKSGESVADNTLPMMSFAYPNPASSTVNFDYTLPASSHALAVVYNIVGQEVMRQELDAFEGRLTLSVNDLQDGIYFCNLTQNGQTVTTTKFVVKK